MPHFRAVLALLSLLLGWAGHAQAEQRRVALVIGNGRYQSVPVLQNAGNDARLMAKTLSGLGFTLIGGGPMLDLDKPAMERAIQEFGRQIVAADVGLFYYAGHGVQVRGSNYLVPTTANPTREADVEFQMVDAQLVLRQMGDAAAKLNIMILDACRNNPFSVTGLRATGGGLAQMGAPEGTLISYATQPGAVALDGDDGDSPFTKGLTASMREPGRSIFDVFNAVGVRVKTATGGRQQPWVSSSPIEGEFFFVPQAPATAAAPPPPSVEVVYWQSIAGVTNPAELQSYLQRYPTGTFADLAHARIAALGGKPASATASAMAPARPIDPVPRPSASPAASKPTVAPATQFDGIYTQTRMQRDNCRGANPWATAKLKLHVHDNRFTFHTKLGGIRYTEIVPVDAYGNFTTRIHTGELSGSIQTNRMVTTWHNGICAETFELSK